MSSCYHKSAKLITAAVVGIIFLIAPACHTEDGIPIDIYLGSGILLPKGDYAPIYGEGISFTAGIDFEFHPAVIFGIVASYFSIPEEFTINSSYLNPYASETKTYHYRYTNLLGEIGLIPFKELFNSPIDLYLCFAGGFGFIHDASVYDRFGYRATSPTMVYGFGGGINYHLNPKYSVFLKIRRMTSAFHYVYAGSIPELDDYHATRDIENLSMSVGLRMGL